LADQGFGPEAFEEATTEDLDAVVFELSEREVEEFCLWIKGIELSLADTDVMDEAA
jgi:hypothetical protein